MYSNNTIINLTFIYSFMYVFIHLFIRRKKRNCVSEKSDKNVSALIK